MQTGSADRNHQIIDTLFQDRINPGRLDRLDDLVAPDYVGPAGETGPSGFAATIQSLRTGFPDIHFTVDDIVADPDRVVVRWTWQGTHTGPFREIAPTHKHVTNSGVGIYQVAGGKLTRAWVMTDRLAFQQQLGLIPAGPTPQPARK